MTDLWRMPAALMPAAQIPGMLVQQMAPPSVEVITGIGQDVQFGPGALFGLGEVLVEVLRDTALRLPPLTRQEAWEMVREIRGFRLLDGYRGRPRADVRAIVDILLRLSQLALDLRERVSEIDIHPLVVFAEGQGASAVDCRIVLKG